MNAFPGRWKAVLAVVVLALLGGGVYFYHLQERRERRDVESDLFTIAELKTGQIAAWRAERLGDASVLTENSLLGSVVEKWFATSSPEEKETLLACFRSLRNSYHYNDVQLADSSGQVRLSLSGQLNHLETESAQALSAALRNHKPVFTDLHTDEFEPTPHLNIVAPLFSPAGAGNNPQNIGAIIFTFRASDFICPLIQSWPVPSQTAETLLVRRDGNDALFLNELRHQTNTALKLRIPLSRTNVPTVMAALGKEGITLGPDYRGVQVLAVLKHIPDSPWFIVAKMDSKEAFADWQFYSGLILALLLALVALAGAVMFVLWQRNQKAHFRALYQAEAARLTSEKRYGVTLKSIGDAVIAADANGRVELLNPVAEYLTGWKDAEARGKPLAEIFRIINEDTRQPAENPVARILREGMVVGLANHTQLIARDGAERAIADSGAPIRDEQNRIAGVVLVFREQTEERKLYQALRDSEVKFRTLFDKSADGILVADIETKKFKYANLAVCQMLGYAEDELRNLGVPDIHPKDAVPGIIAEFDGQVRGDKTLAVDIPCLRKDGSVVHADINAVSLTVDGRLCNVGFFRDITERRRMEAALGESRNFLDKIINSIADPIFVKNQQHQWVLLNEAFCNLMGRKRDELLGKSDHDFFPKNEADVFWAKDENVFTAGTENINEEEFTDAKGMVHAIVTKKTLYTDEKGGKFIVGIISDVTERKRAEETLRQSQKEFKDLFDHAPVGFHELDTDGRIVRINQTELKMLGWSAEELLGQSIWKLSTTEETSRRTVLAKLRGELPPSQGFERLFRRKDGSTFPVWISDRMLKGADGAIIGLHGAVQDITERKQAESRITDALNFNQTVLRASPVGIGVFKTAGPCVSANEAIGQIIGGTREEVLKQNFRQLESWKNSGMLAAAEAALATQAEHKLETEMLTSFGKLVWCACRFVPFPYEGEQHLLLIIGDITERKQVETKLRESEERFRRIFEEGPTGIAMLDEKFRFIHVNPVFVSLLGYSVEEIQTMTFPDITHPDHVQTDVEQVRRLLRGELSVYRTEKRYLTKSGKVLWGQMQASVMRNADGKFRYLLAIISDITERKQAEEKLNERMEELLAWESVTLGREGRVMELKKEVNGLLAEAGKPPRYKNPEEDTSPPPPRT